MKRRLTATMLMPPAALLAAAALLLFPTKAPAQNVLVKDNAKTLFSISDGSNIVESVSGEDGIVRLVVNGKAVTWSGDGTVRRASYPFILAPSVDKALIVGQGNGESAAVALAMGSANVEILSPSEPVAKAASHLSAISKIALESKRVELKYGKLNESIGAAKGNLNVIIAGLNSQDTLENRDILTVETFTKLKSLLAPDGVMVQWIHLSSMETDDMRRIVASFVKAFPRVTVWSGDLNPVNSWIALVGSGKAAPLDFNSVKNKLSASDTNEMAEWNNPYSFLSFYICDETSLMSVVDGVKPSAADNNVSLPKKHGDLEDMGRSADNFAFWMNYRNTVVKLFTNLTPDDALKLRAYHDARSKILNGRKIGIAGAAADEIQWYDKAVADAPDEPHLALSYLAIGLAYYRSNILERAANLIEKAKKIAPDKPLIRFYLGKTYEKMGHSAKANAEFAELKKLAPDYVERIKMGGKGAEMIQAQ